MAENKEMLLEIKGLKTYYRLAEGVVRAVDGVDLTLRRGHTLGVVGESGCGKSQTSMSIMRLIPPPGKIEEGQILYYPPMQSEPIDLVTLSADGREIRSIRGNQISMVFQEPMTAMSPVLTVGRQIAEAIMLHQQVTQKQAYDITVEILSKVRMPNPERVINDYPFQLSGGMRQRAVIAMALSCNPNLLIADEPTTALDVTTEAQILDLMRSLQSEFGMAIMYITHNLGVVAEMAEEVAVMYLGKIVEQADVRSIFFEPLHPYTKGLLKSIPHLQEAVARGGQRARLQTIKGVVPDPYTILKGCPFHPRCPQLIKGTCNQVAPPTVSIKSGHTVRCHLYA